MKDQKDIEAFQQGEIRALSRFISRAEDHDPALVDILAQLHGARGKAKVIGFTGPPGAGKSTLVSAIISLIRQKNHSVAVIAVDPVSPFSGGALLGDRIRLLEHFNDPKVFIRSLSTRGKLGGLSKASREVIDLTDAFGFDYVIVETVGVGQSEVDIRSLSDLTVVVVTPEGGDGIQTLKAGVLEIGDLFIVNKADRKGADQMVQDLKTMLEFSKKSSVEIFTTDHNKPGFYQKLLEGIDRYFSTQAAEIAKRREARNTAAFQGLIEAYVVAEAREWMKSRSSQGTNPYLALQQFRKKYSPGTLFPR